MESPDTLISVVIVNYKVPDFVCQAVRSVHEAELAEQTEIIVVDNNSGDNSQHSITEAFSDIIWIGLKSNLGFGKACNVGAHHARGKYVLFLNPDTLISHNTLKVCVDLLENNPDVGIAGPKILNPDGSFQASCRRGFPTPFNGFSHLFGLSKLFPRSRTFGQYNMTYLDPDVEAEVDAISGSFMFMRTSAFEKIGGFDESFFMYGEDLDLCAKARQDGYAVWYTPKTQIVHFKGKSSAKQSIRSRAAFYEAMILFSRKYRNSYGTFIPGWLIFLGIGIQATVNMAQTFVRSLFASLVDLVLINVVVLATISIRFSLVPGAENPYTTAILGDMLIMHALMSVIFLATYAIRGMFFTGRYSFSSAVISGFLASVTFLALLYFIRSLAFSRIAFAISAILLSFILPLWREAFSKITHLKNSLYSTGKVIIIGDGPIASLLINNVEKDSTARITGIIWPHETEKPPVTFEGYPVLGTLKNLKRILETNPTHQLIIGTRESWYSYIIEALASRRKSKLTIKWVPTEILNMQQDLPEVVPLQNFTV
ncbi:MAG: glycosyltransferase [Chitinispirillaceae bacterium]